MFRKGELILFLQKRTLRAKKIHYQFRLITVS